MIVHSSKYFPPTGWRRLMRTEGEEQTGSSVAIFFCLPSLLPACDYAECFIIVLPKGRTKEGGM